MIKRFLLIFILLFIPFVVFAEGELKIALSEASIHTSDIESIKRGARFFAANCMSCHTMVYLRYNSLAQEAGVTYDKMPVNVKDWPYGAVPPDLSLEADFRGVDWVYTYLHSFYQDTARPTGVNNLLVPNTAMPGIIIPFQGTQTRVVEPLPTIFHPLHWYDLLILQQQGAMTPDQFDRTTADVVNFLAYAANPYQATQHAIGWWVIGFLFVLFVLSYFLKREYWKDIDRRRKN